MKKAKFEPNYSVPPIDIIADMALHQLLTSEWVSRIERDGITAQDAILLEALFRTPRSFFSNLQKNYEKDKKKSMSNTTNKTEREWEEEFDRKFIEISSRDGFINPLLGKVSAGYIKPFIFQIEDKAYQQGLAEGKAYQGKTKREWYQQGFREAIGKLEKYERETGECYFYAQEKASLKQGGEQ